MHGLKVFVKYIYILINLGTRVTPILFLPSVLWQ